MTTQELEQKLNQLDDYTKFQVTEYDKDQVKLSEDSDMSSGLGLVQIDKGEIWIHVLLGDDQTRFLLFKIIPPDAEERDWSINLESQVVQYDLIGLEIYIKTLEIIKQFLAYKESEQDDN